MTRVVFHLGDKKTGSTAIQTTLGLKAWTCDSVKLTYPVSGGFSHIGLAKSLQFRHRQAVGPVRQSAIAGHFKEVADRIRAEKPDVALISAEHFEEVDPLVLRDAVKTYLPEFAATATFIAYVRPHAERLSSSFSERIKQGIFWGSIEDLHKQMLTNDKLLYTPRFSRWREVFGDRFELRPMIRDLLYRKDVVADVLQFILQTDDFQVLPVQGTNESLSLENLAILRRFQLAVLDGGSTVLAHQAAFGWSIARRMNASPLSAGTKVQLHRTLAESVLEHYHADAVALDAAFFQGKPMTGAILAAPGKAVAEPQSVQAEDHFSPRELQLADIFIDQIKALSQVDPKQLAKDLREQHRAALQAAGPHSEESLDDVGKSPAGKSAGTLKAESVGRRSLPGKAGAGKRANGKAGAGKGDGGKAGGGKRLGAGPGKAGPGKGGAGKGGLRMAGRGRAGKPAADTEE